VLLNVLGAGNGLVLKAGGLGFRLIPGKNLLNPKDGKRLVKRKGGLGGGTGATTFDRSMGWFARGKLPSDPSKFCVCAQAGAANKKTPRTKNQIPNPDSQNLVLGIWFLEFAKLIQVPMRMLRLLARISAYFTLMEGATE
jgi:hypothetical protein